MEKKIFIHENDFQKARKKIKESKGKKIIFSSSNDELNRKILEKEKIGVLLLNQSQRRDRMKQRSSGLNHVLAKIAKKKGVAIGINLDEIIDPKPKEKIEILSRIRQNIKICNKNKLKMEFISQKNKRDVRDLKSLGLSLGMPTWMTKSI
jgi:ribonuclease P/MRP protein subunit RPP1